MIRDGYCTWFGVDLPLGTYSFTAYWVPAEEAHDLGMSVDDVVHRGTPSSPPPCEFTIE
jgi:hypothetical protein